MELFEKIRRERRVEGLSIRELAERHQVHRRTVRQALASAVPPPRKPYSPRPRPAIEPWTAIIDGWLLADRDAPRKQRHTARRIWQRLVAEHGATCSEVTVSRYVARRRRELGVDRDRGDDPADTPARRRGRGRLRRVPRGARRGRGEVLDVRDAAVELGPGVPRRVRHPGPGGVPRRPRAGVHALRRGARVAALRQPQTGGGPGLQGPRPRRVRAVHRAAPGRARTERTRRAGSRARSAASAAATWSRSRTYARWPSSPRCWPPPTTSTTPG
ncbi:mobile element protein [Pseudonocardia sp. N23]|nr:mobile element protein [Pseudonocardia sp. N23]